MSRHDTSADAAIASLAAAPAGLPLRELDAEPGAPDALSTALPADHDALGADVEALTFAPPSNLVALPRLRADLWNLLRDAARRISRDFESADDPESEAVRAAFERAARALARLEGYHAFPGKAILRYLTTLYERGDLNAVAKLAVRVARVRAAGNYRRVDLAAARAGGYLELMTRDDKEVSDAQPERARPYFEVLVVDESGDDQAAGLARRLRAFRTDEDPFVYELVVVSRFEDALLAVLANPRIEACMLWYSFGFASREPQTGLLARLYALLGEDPEALRALRPGQRTAALGMLIARLRSEIDVYRITDAPVENVVGAASTPFRRVFYEAEDLQDLHVSVLTGVAERFEAPFFDALRRYAERPTGMFHALPLSRGRTIAKSSWIQDFGAFYGSRLFLAETSATTGGLDSLLQPTGSLRQAQRLAARAFGSKRTWFVTNGTSTANKIVLHALLFPGDLLLLSHDCHKSHPYAAILSGAHLLYLEGYPLPELSMYGGIPLRRIKAELLALRRAGALHKARVMLLTNVTFDGLTYDPYRVMREVLAIHPGMIFVWDEAWFAYARFAPLLRPRTAMDAAERLRAELRSPEHQARFAAWTPPDEDDDDAWLGGPLHPDPALAHVRVYATQSTHKTLTALRQGSMIHVHDELFERKVADSFHDAYMVHTSTSPNYQILASLDVGRRQVELEGFAFVQESVDLSLLLRERIRLDPALARYFDVLGPGSMIPAALRPSGIERYVEQDGALAEIERAWTSDEFVLDPTRVTVHVGRTGMDGDTFKRHLMDRYAIHINKTSRNSVLFLIHIGAARGTLAHLVEVLSEIARECEQWYAHANHEERARFDQRVRSLTKDLPPLPDFSSFHPAFASPSLPGARAGDIRRAYYLAYEDGVCAHLPLDAALAEAISAGRALVSASFVTPYPPGFPVLVPGQIVSRQIVDYLLALDVTEIHGLHPELGMAVFKDEVIAEQQPEPLTSIVPARHRKEP